MKLPTITASELDWLLRQVPETYDSLALYHEIKATEADATGFHEAVTYHDKRKAEMQAVATHIRQAHEQGDPAAFED